MPTINDVATQAHVSASTVSHVVNGTRFVDPETEERVRLAIKTLGYRPNSLARSLRRRQTSTIGLLVPDNSNAFFADIARTIEDAGFAQNYSVILCNSDLSEEKQARYLDVLLSKQVDGIILISSGNRLDPVHRILSANVPVVVVDREVGDLPVDQVLVDNEQGGYAAGHYLVQLGHRRIGCIAGPNDITPSAARIAGFRRALAEAGVKLPPACIVRGNGRYEDGEAAMRELLRRDVGVTAIFAYNDLMAIGAMSTLRRAGIEVPEAVSVIGFDNIVQASMMVPALTTIAQPVADLGDVSVRLLLERMRQRDRHASRIVLPTTVIERESCRMLHAHTSGAG
jgi:LacI family transcriptional regulator